MNKLCKCFGCRVAAQLGKGHAPVLHRLTRRSSMQMTMVFYASADDILYDAIHQLDQTSPVPQESLSVNGPADGPAGPENEKELVE
jgi:hypothetical protein